MIRAENGFTLFGRPRSPAAFPVLPLLLVLLALAIVYGNSLHCGWYLDDRYNILDNRNVQPRNASWSELSRSFYGVNPVGGAFRRPLAYFSIAGNWLAGGAEVFGYHLFNLAVHGLTAVFLLLFLRATLALPAVSLGPAALPTALLAVVFWATHPIQVTAVTYIVQRMAAMAAMFSIAAMYVYLRARLSTTLAGRTGGFGLAALLWLAALACKENTLMLPACIWLYDLFFIQGLSGANLRRNLKLALPVLAVLAAAGIWYASPAGLINQYRLRPFGPFERLLTQPRVIWFHIGQLLYPQADRFMLLHDFPVSGSLLTPGTTLPAIAALAAVFGLCLAAARTYPLAAYCGLFFLLNHLIEGSILPLEIVFEHRNYLPSMLFFVPLARFALYWMDYFSYRRSIQFLAAVAVAVALSAQGHTTWQRNAVFQTAIRLWTDNVRKAPGLHRPHNELGNAWFVAGDHRRGAAEMHRALAGRAAAHVFQKYISWSNLGSYHFYRNEDEKAEACFNRALELAPTFPLAHERIARIRLYRGDLPGAIRYATRALELDPLAAEFHCTMGYVFLRLGRPSDALAAARHALKMPDAPGSAHYLRGESWRVLGRLPAAAAAFRTHLRHHREQLAPDIALLEIFEKMNDEAGMRRQALRLLRFTSHGPDNREGLENLLRVYNRRYNYLGPDRIDRVRAAILNVLDGVKAELQPPPTGP